MKYTFIVITVLITSLAGWAQLRQIPIQYPVPAATSNPSGRMQALTPIILPFWDDFSTSSGLLDTTWWVPGSQVQILPRPGNGILPPTSNVATFDGNISPVFS